VGSSGLIYAAIVAAWAAVLVPRWVRRNEEVEQARDLDQARGVRVLPRPDHVRKVGGSPSHRHPTPDTDDPSTDDTSDQRDGEFGIAAQRRRRVLLLLTLVLALSTLGTVAGHLPGWAVAVPGLLLAVFVLLARRAAVTEARRRAMVRRRAVSRTVVPVGRIAVLDEPEPVPPEDPDAWEPVPVPLPTYVTKAKAPDLAGRRIDLSQPGAWTSGRLDTAAWIALSRARQAVEGPSQRADDLPERRRAVGD
jgi:hypothetical protein